jgi:hypothetical protein
MRGRLLGWLKAVPAALWAVLAGAVALLVAFLRGRATGRTGEQQDQRMRQAGREAQKVRRQAAAGDDAGVQKELAAATERARKVTGK